MNTKAAVSYKNAHDLLMPRAMNYKKSFNPESKFFETKNNDGQFTGNFGSKRWEAGFTEGNAEQFRFNVPFDVKCLKHFIG